MNSSFTVDMAALERLLNDRGLGTNGRVQKYIDNAVLRLSEPIVPMQQGNLKGSGQSGTSVGSGVVCYNAPYARYQYYGKVMAGRAPKHVTGTPLQYNGAPIRGAKWFERMKATHLEAILEGAKREAGTE